MAEDDEVRAAARRAVAAMIEARPQPKIDPARAGDRPPQAHPIDRATEEAALAVQNYAALAVHTFEVQKRFIRYVSYERDRLPPAEQDYVDPIIRQMVKSLNAGAVEQTEAAGKSFLDFTTRAASPPTPPTLGQKFKKWWKEN